MTVKQVIVTIKEDDISRFDEVKKALQNRHLQVVDEYSHGVIVGMIEDADIPAIAELAEIKSVELDAEVVLPSPDSPIQ